MFGRGRFPPSLYALPLLIRIICGGCLAKELASFPSTRVDMPSNIAVV